MVARFTPALRYVSEPRQIPESPANIRCSRTGSPFNIPLGSAWPSAEVCRDALRKRCLRRPFIRCQLRCRANCRDASRATAEPVRESVGNKVSQSIEVLSGEAQRHVAARPDLLGRVETLFAVRTGRLHRLLPFEGLRPNAPAVPGIPPHDFE